MGCTYGRVVYLRKIPELSVTPPKERMIDHDYVNNSRQPFRFVHQSIIYIFRYGLPEKLSIEE